MSSLRCTCAVFSDNRDWAIGRFGRTREGMLITSESFKYLSLLCPSGGLLCNFCSGGGLFCKFLLGGGLLCNFCLGCLPAVPVSTATPWLPCLLPPLHLSRTGTSAQCTTQAADLGWALVVEPCSSGARPPGSGNLACYLSWLSVLTPHLAWGL